LRATDAIVQELREVEQERSKFSLFDKFLNTQDIRNEGITGPGRFAMLPRAC
jgi:hypothetical protein